MRRSTPASAGAQSSKPPFARRRDHESRSAQGGSRAAQPPSEAREPLTRPSTPRSSTGAWDFGRRTEKFWGRRYRSILCVDADAEVARLIYLFLQGCKEGLVGSPLEWPGASSVRATLTGEPLRGVWIDRTKEFNARKKGLEPTADEFATTYEVRLSPLPAWSTLSEDEYRKKCAELVADIERETRETNKAKKRRPIGVARILAQDPHDHPKSIARSPAPLCHASSFAMRSLFRAHYRAFVECFQEASARLRAGLVEALAEFPEGCFPPRFPYRPYVTAPYAGLSA